MFLKRFVLLFVWPLSLSLSLSLSFSLSLSLSLSLTLSLSHSHSHSHTHTHSLTHSHPFQRILGWLVLVNNPFFVLRSTEEERATLKQLVVAVQPGLAFKCNCRLVICLGYVERQHNVNLFCHLFFLRIQVHLILIYPFSSDPIQLPTVSLRTAYSYAPNNRGPTVADF